MTEDVKQYRAARFRLYPSSEQESALYKNAGCCRFIYNWGLDLCQKTYNKTGKGISKYDLMKKLPELKKAKKTSWLADADSHSLQYTCIHLGKAFDNFFRRVKQGQTPGYPNFKKKQGNDSFSVGMNIYADEEQSSLRIGKLGWVKARGGWDMLLGKPKRITVSQDGSHWYASVNFEHTPENKQNKFALPAIGIDIGIAKPYVGWSETNGGTTFNSLTYKARLDKAEKKRKWAQRWLCRKKKGSNNRAKSRNRLQACYRKERNTRVNYLSKLTTQIATKVKVVCVEDLQLSRMTRRSTKTKDVITQNKTGLNREMLRFGHGMFLSLLERKCAEKGGQLIKVNPRYTSQTCNKCGCISKLNRKSQAKFVCIDCGHKANADINAAKNILEIGLGKLEISYT